MNNSLNWHEEVFYHITMDCNLRCKHCYAGDYLSAGQYYDRDKIISDLLNFRSQGTKKIVLLGGEPTTHPEFAEIFNKAIEIGFEKVVIDTNGQIELNLPFSPQVLKRLKIRFSFEGADSDTNDRVRGKGSFIKSINNLKKIIGHGVSCEITCTINRHNYKKLEDLVIFFYNLGVHEFNFHFLSITGTAKYNQSLLLEPEEIFSVQNSLQSLSMSKDFTIRFPRLIVYKDDYQEEINKGLRCLINDNKRLLVFNNGKNLFCPLEISQDIPNSNNVTTLGVCPFEHLLFPKGLPKNYKMTCISWK